LIDKENLIKQRELDKQRELEKQKEIDKQKELDKQKEINNKKSKEYEEEIIEEIIEEVVETEEDNKKKSNFLENKNLKDRTKLATIKKVAQKKSKPRTTINPLNALDKIEEQSNRESFANVTSKKIDEKTKRN